MRSDHRLSRFTSAASRRDLRIGGGSHQDSLRPAFPARGFRPSTSALSLATSSTSTRATSIDAGATSIDAGYLDARYLVAARVCRVVRAQVEGQDNGGGRYDDDNGCGDVDLA